MAFSFSFDLPVPDETALPALLAAPAPQWPVVAPEPPPPGLDLSPTWTTPQTAQILPRAPADLTPLRRMVTGGPETERWVNVPEVMATNTASFNVPKPIAIAPRFAPQAELPAIFKTIQPLENAASRMTGYDPRNPPQVHTITEAQFTALPPLLQEQYLATAERRARMISDARHRQTELANMAINAEVAKQRKAAQDADVAKEQLASALQAKQNADRALDAAARRLSKHEAEASKAAAKGWLTGFDAKKKVWMGDDRHTDLAETLNTERPDIDRAYEAAAMAKTEADRAYRDAQILAARAGLSTQAGLPSILQTPAINVILNPATGRFEIAK